MNLFFVGNRVCRYNNKEEVGTIVSIVRGQVWIEWDSGHTQVIPMKKKSNEMNSNNEFQVIRESRFQIESKIDAYWPPDRMQLNQQNRDRTTLNVRAFVKWPGVIKSITRAWINNQQWRTPLYLYTILFEDNYDS